MQNNSLVFFLWVLPVALLLEMCMFLILVSARVMHIRGRVEQFFNSSGRAWILVNFYFLSTFHCVVCHSSILFPASSSPPLLSLTTALHGYTEALCFYLILLIPCTAQLPVTHNSNQRSMLWILYYKLCILSCLNISSKAKNYKSLNFFLSDKKEMGIEFCGILRKEGRQSVFLLTFAPRVSLKSFPLENKSELFIMVCWSNCAKFTLLFILLAWISPAKWKVAASQPEIHSGESSGQGAIGNLQMYVTHAG